MYSRAQCKAKETVVPGTQGPIGPIGPQGQTGPQGPAGASGINNSPCVQGDTANGAWTFTFFDNAASNETDICFIAFDANGNIQAGGSPYCNQTIGTSTIQVPIVQASLVLHEGLSCFYGLTITKANSMTWIGGMWMDRTRSVLQGVAGIDAGGGLVRTNSTSTGTRWGAVGAAGAAQSASAPQIDQGMLDEAGRAYRKSISGE